MVDRETWKITVKPESNAKVTLSRKHHKLINRTWTGHSFIPSQQQFISDWEQSPSFWLEIRNTLKKKKMSEECKIFLCCSELCWIMVQWIPLVEDNNIILFTDLDCIQGRSTSRTEVFAASLLLYIIRTSLRQVPTVDWSHSSIVTVNSSTINQDQT